jgi:ribosome-binding factor A
VASRRVQRLNEQLKREISHLLRTQVHDPRVSGVIVTGVQVSPDLAQARVWTQLPGDDERRADALQGLAAAAPFVRKQLGVAMRVRRIPELEFFEDRSLEQAMRIEALLREVRRDQTSDPAEATDAEETGEEGESDR